MRSDRTGESSVSRILKPAAVYFALVFGAGFLLGCIRVPFLVPRLGVRTAELLEMPIQLVVIVLAARFVVRRFAVPPQALVRLAVGLLALAFALAAELLLAVAMTGPHIGDYIAGRDPVAGSVYLIVLIIFAALPWMMARRPAPDSSSARTVRRTPKR
jgi:hypothetical protein